ncbi:hypothetical protein Trydic_g18967 [Trypoxylus dichotomus]
MYRYLHLYNYHVYDSCKSPRHSTGITHAVVKETTKQRKDKRSQDWWKSISIQRQAKKFLVGYKATFTMELLRKEKMSVRTTGHGILKKRMYSPDLTKAKIYVKGSLVRLLGLVKKAKLMYSV